MALDYIRISIVSYGLKVIFGMSSVSILHYSCTPLVNKAALVLLYQFDDVINVAA